MKSPLVTRKVHEKEVADLKWRLQLTERLHLEAEAKLDRQMKLNAAMVGKARATFEPYFDAPGGLRTGRRLRCDYIIDDRAVVLGHESNMKEAIADLMAHHARQAVLSLDFALAKGIMEGSR